MANPRFNKRIYFDDSICCHCRKRAFDGGVGIIAFRIVSGALPTYAVDFEVRVTEAKSDVFMGRIGQRVIEFRKVERTFIFRWRIAIEISDVCAYFDFSRCRDADGRHDHL